MRGLKVVIEDGWGGGKGKEAGSPGRRGPDGVERLEMTGTKTRTGPNNTTQQQVGRKRDQVCNKTNCKEMGMFVGIRTVDTKVGRHKSN